MPFLFSRWAPAVVAGVLTAAFALWDPPLRDLAAHTFRADYFAEHGFAIWNNAWYGGHYLPAYSVLFSQASREQKYKARAAIDTVIFRTGDLIGSWAFSGLLVLGLGLRGVAALSAAIAIPWLLLGWWLARAGSPQPR